MVQRFIRIVINLTLNAESCIKFYFRIIITKMLNRKDVTRMENVSDVAFYIFYMYQQKTRQPLDEMKLLKLLCFSQRESLVRNGQPLFLEEFQGWKYGPVCVSVRRLYRKQLLWAK